MANAFIIRHGDPEKYHNWNVYVCSYCGCEFIEDGNAVACPECSHPIVKETKIGRITDKEAREIMTQQSPAKYFQKT